MERGEMRDLLKKRASQYILVWFGIFLMINNWTFAQFRFGDVRRDWFPPALTTLEFHVGEPVALEAGDFNGDGWDDLVIGVYNAQNGRQISTFYVPNTGDGHFVSPYLVAESPVLQSPIQGAGGEGVVADLDNDGDLDVVMFYTITVLEDGTPSVKNSLLVLWGNGEGSFRPQWLEMPLVVYTFMQPVNPVAVADFDGDGLKDIAYPKFYPPSIEVLYNRGDHSWERKEFILIPAKEKSSVAMPLSLVADDLDGDGKSDVVIGGFCVTNADKQQGYKRFVKVYLNDGREVFSYLSDVPDLTPLAPSVYLTDLTNDGVKELVLTKPLRKQSPKEMYLDRKWIDECLIFRGARSGKFFYYLGSLAVLWGEVVLYIGGDMSLYTIIAWSLGNGWIGIGQWKGMGYQNGGFNVLDDAVAVALGDIDNDSWIEIIAAIRTWGKNATRIVIVTRKKSKQVGMLESKHSK